LKLFERPLKFPLKLDSLISNSIIQNDFEIKIHCFNIPLFKMSARKTPSLKIKDKLEIIRRINAGEKRINLSRYYQVPTSTITYIHKHKDTYCENE